MYDIFENDDSSLEDILVHYGTKYHSGRYPYGSGEDPYQHDASFLGRIKELKSQGMSEVDIAKNLGYSSTTEFRKAKSNAINEQKSYMIDRAKSLQKDGLTPTQIATELGLSKSAESKIRYWLNSDTQARVTRAKATSDILTKEVASKKVIDVGSGVERELGVSRQVLDNAIKLAQENGYELRGIRMPQVNNPGKYTTMKVLCDPSVPYKTLYDDKSIIKSVGEYHSVDGGKRWDKREYPSSISSDRVAIRYGDQGGIDKDGVIEIRPGVADLNLGNSHYAQVRIMVDGTHYLKGMAMYSDDIPEGQDIVFNTNKKSGTPKEKVLKAIKDDPDNPFGAYIKANGQSHYVGSDGKEHLSAINKLKEEGDWDTMSRNLSSQFLSKQPMQLINRQLKLTYDDKVAEYDEIMSYTNPAIKKKMLMDFADSCDSAAVHMKAAALPRQSTRVILPVTQLKDTECYAPYLNNGDTVYLVRYPHGGTFEIPKLVVNNKNPTVKKILGNATDAIGINSHVAGQLSGADFDGDTVVVIPANDKVKINARKPLEELKDFDPKTKYGSTSEVITNRNGEKVEVYYNNAGHRFKPMSESNKQNQMGVVSNLITDMTLRNASDDEIARAVRHSMVVIDAVKHKLDYKQSERDNQIEALRKKYQPHMDNDGYGGASTLLSRRKQDTQVDERVGGRRIDKETGKIYYKNSNREYTDAKGNIVRAKTSTPLVLEVEDTRSLSSGTPQENAYADFSNKMKALGNKARKEYMATPLPKKDPQAAKIYQSEVESLESKLNIAELNKPKERRAQALANSVIEAKKKACPELADKSNKKELAKVARYAIEDARLSVGASGKNSRIEITDSEWKAIQSNAISGTKLNQILRYTDTDKLKERALPKSRTTITTAKLNKIKAMQASGYSIAEIANSIGCSASTVSKYLNNPKEGEQ